MASEIIINGEVFRTMGAIYDALDKYDETVDLYGDCTVELRGNPCRVEVWGGYWEFSEEEDRNEWRYFQNAKFTLRTAEDFRGLAKIATVEGTPYDRIDIFVN